MGFINQLITGGHHPVGLLMCFFFIQFGHLVGAMATHPFFVSSSHVLPTMSCLVFEVLQK